MGSTGIPVGDRCPGCGTPPRYVFGGGRQAFCFAEECRVMTWDPTATLDELLDDVGVLETPPHVFYRGREGPAGT